MEVKIVETGKDKMAVRIGGVDAAYTNALRRYMQFEVPTMAIEDVEFRTNNAILYDEMVSLRLGLIPLKTDLESYNLQSECPCKGAGCSQCQLAISLKASGPKTVLAGEMKTKDPKVKPVYPGIPIVKLLDGQDLAFEATAALGTGKEHAKWSPGLVYYRLVPILDIKQQPKNGDEIARRCPTKSYDYKAGQLSVNPKTAEDCIMCNECVELSNGAISVISGDEYFLMIESWGQLSPEDIAITGVEVFTKQLQSFAKIVKDLEE